MEGRTLRPGMNYSHYRTPAEIPKLARPFYEAAAGAAGLSVHELAAAVFRTENKLEAWIAEKRKKNKRVKALDDVSDDAEDEDVDMDDGHGGMIREKSAGEEIE